MSKILGLDLGTNSIGWAVVDDENNKIIDSGVRIFPEGVTDTGTKKEKSKNATRREFRQSRRQYFRKKLRKIKLLEALIDNNMCPLTMEELEQWKNYSKEMGNEGRKFPSSLKFVSWLKLNPYKLRKEGLEKDLTLEEFGRVLYHLIQRRGFWSNRKVTDKMNKGSEDKNITGIKETFDKVGESKEYQTLGEFLYDISYKDKVPYKQILDEDGKELRVRARYTIRDMYVKEFEILWNRQAEQLELNQRKGTIEKRYLVGNPYKNGLKGNGLKKRLSHRLDYLKSKGITANLEIDESNLRNTKLIVTKRVSLKELLGGGDIIKQEDSILSYQRPLRVQKYLLDECTYEKTLRDENGKVILNENGNPKYAGKKPCPISHPLAEIRRSYEFINNIEYGDRQKLNGDQCKVVLDLINSKDRNFDFELIPKALNLEYEKFNFDAKHKVPANYTHKHLKPLFSEDVWNKEYKVTMNDTEQIEYGYERIWHCFYFYTDNDKLVDKLHKDFGLKESNFDKVRGALQVDGTRKNPIILKDGYGNLSLKAIKNILPFLEKGYKYSDAVILGGVRNSFGKRWGYFENKHDEIEKSIVEIIREKENKEGEAIEKIKGWLVNNNFGFEPEDDSFLGLYHHSQDTNKHELKDELPEPKNLRNPIVQQALYELRGLVNALSKEYLKEGNKFDRINVELARDLKQSRERRINQWQINKQRENENSEARNRLDEYGLAHSRNNIHKYLLWKELQNENGNSICPYTGKTISITDLFNNNKFQIEHIIPYGKSLDDSLANKTLCDAEENGKKGERTPFEFYSSDKERWDKIAARAFKILPYNKAKRFTNKTAHKTDFIERQLNDTRYISKEAANYLKQIVNESDGKKVFVFPGQLTADLRNKWGLNNILNPPIETNDSEEPGRYWAHTDTSSKPVAFYPVFNKRPKNEKGEFVITGNLEGEEYDSKYLALKFKADGKPDGKYWAKIKVNDNPVNLISILRPRPETEKDEILVFGKTDEKGKFNSKYLNSKLENDLENDTSYWAKLTVQPNKTVLINRYSKKKLPKTKKNNIILYGKVNNETFYSNIYTCHTNIEDGKYDALIEVDLDNTSFYKVKNDEPEIKNNQIKIVGKIQNRKFQPNINRLNFYNVDSNSVNDGLYWVVFELKSDPYDFTMIKNTEPLIENGKLTEGAIRIDDVSDVDEKTGEILKEEQRKHFYSSKERNDHRHHAIDAIVVALTRQEYLQSLSTFNSNKEEKKRGNKYDKGKLNFAPPWNSFLTDAEKQIKQILISHKKTDRLLTKKITKDYKTGKKNEGIGARGQLHREFLYGKPTIPQSETIYHIRKSISDIKNNKHINKIVDSSIKKLIINHLLQNYQNIDFTKGFDVPSDAFFKADKNGIKQPRLFLKNRNGEPVPIKKVRIKKEIGGAEKLKEINQYVNPRNNHHVLIYENKQGKLCEDVVTFWNAVERKKQNQPIFQLPLDGMRLICTLQTNDMFLLGLNEGEIDFDNQEILGNHLYRVQKFTSGDYYFRHHLASTIKNDNERTYIKNFGDGSTGWLTYNPIKVKISRLGKIEKIEND